MLDDSGVVCRRPVLILLLFSDLGAEYPYFPTFVSILLAKRTADTIASILEKHHRYYYQR